MKYIKYLLLLSLVFVFTSCIKEDGDNIGKNQSKNCNKINDRISTSYTKKTGQKNSYFPNGEIVEIGCLKDDGYYRGGVDPRYSKNNVSGIVTDGITGLQWQDSSDTGKPWLNQVNFDKCLGQNGQVLDESKCSDTSGDTAISYCNSLSLAGYDDWRLPSIDELMYIADRSKKRKAIDERYFQHIIPSIYWSSTTFQSNKPMAWSVNFEVGRDFQSSKSAVKGVVCVRNNNQVQQDKYIRDDAKQIVQDTKQNLIWQDNADAKGKQLQWFDAITYCEDLKLGGYTDWRMPNINELFFVANRDEKEPAMNGVAFKNISSWGFYWSSTSFIISPDAVWSVEFANGTTKWPDKSNKEYIRCVRDGD